MNNRSGDIAVAFFCAAVAVVAILEALYRIGA
jgi:hypothetical protein